MRLALADRTGIATGGSGARPGRWFAIYDPRSMCGLAGYSGVPGADRAALDAMCAAITHRGPDSSGAHIDDPAIGMGFRRLSIIDLETGDQPLYNEDRSIAVTCNGEIYNFRELREGLRSRGHEFRTNSDAEVICHLYEERGEDFLAELRGMFAIALWDASQQRLLLARDRLGVKPLYWARSGTGLVYGSEPGAVLAGGLVDPSPDPAAILDYLTAQYVPPPRSGYLGLAKLAPGELLTFSPGGEPRVKSYWELAHDPGGFDGDDEEGLRQADELLREATEMRMISDVPLGAFLSGGVDSSLIVSYMAEMSSTVRTFAIDFEEKRFSEGAHAQRVAELYGTDHETFLVEPDLVPLVAAAMHRLGEPFADSSAIPTYLLSEMTRRSVTVALSGDGGDEAFGGYERYALASRADRYDWLAAPLGRIGSRLLPAALARRYGRVARGLDVLAMDADQRYSALMVHFAPPDLKAICTPEFLESAGGADRTWNELFEPADVPGMQRYLALDIETYLPGDLLVKVDRMSMAHSLEVRSPMLDHRVHEFAATLPAGMKLRGTTTKWLLRELSVRRGLPRDLGQRRKQGFGVPIGDWFRGELRGWLTDVLGDPRTRERGYFKPGATDRLMAEHLDGRRDHTARLWNLMMLELWHRDWIDG